MRQHLATFASALATAGLVAFSWATSHAVVLTVAAFCAALIAIITAIRTLAGLGPVRWLWHQLVVNPVASKLREEVRETLHEWWTAEDGPAKRIEALERAVGD